MKPAKQVRVKLGPCTVELSIQTEDGSIDRAHYSFPTLQLGEAAVEILRRKARRLNKLACELNFTVAFKHIPAPHNL